MYTKHIVRDQIRIYEALKIISSLPDNSFLILFVVNESNELIGTLTDGDIRRALIKNHNINETIETAVNRNPKKFYENEIDNNIHFDKSLKLIPIVNEKNILVKILRVDEINNKINSAALLMAGGLGSRLRPLTNSTPKPMLRINNKPILEYNIDNLIKYGVKDFYISVKYLKEQIIDYFGNGESKNINIYYIEEDEPLGTIGAISKIKKLGYDYMIVQNSDLLTNINFRDLYINHINKNKKLTVATFLHDVYIPYAVFEKNNNDFICKEKPTYSFQTNSGIYILNKCVIKKIPENTFYNATDLIDELISINEINLFSFNDFWLDIGSPNDFEKAKNSIKNLNF